MFALEESAPPSYLDQAIELLEKATAELEPEPLDSSGARAALDRYARARRLADFGIAALARKVGDAAVVSRATGTPVGQARATIELGTNLRAAPELSAALATGAVSVEQAREIASAECSVSGVTEDLVGLANSLPFHVFKDHARKLKLDAEQHNGLATKQHAARAGSHYSDELGMTHIHLIVKPLDGTLIVNRAEADAERLYKAARKTGLTEPFEAYLADAFVAMLSGNGTGRASRPELVVLIDYDTIRDGWKLTPKGISKIPGVGPIDPTDAKALAHDAFINAVVADGKDLRHLKRFSRHVPPEIKVALELGEPLAFDGPVCSECGNRFRPQRDHLEPVVSRGPTSYPNLKWKCDPCHVAKTERDRRAGKLKPTPEKDRKRRQKAGRPPPDG
ncbi:MAG: HNH endonuclease [Actinomycetota bacterium]